MATQFWLKAAESSKPSKNPSTVPYCDCGSQITFSKLMLLLDPLLQAMYLSTLPHTVAAPEKLPKGSETFSPQNLVSAPADLRKLTMPVRYLSYHEIVRPSPVQVSPRAVDEPAAI